MVLEICCQGEPLDGALEGCRQPHSRLSRVTTAGDMGLAHLLEERRQITLILFFFFILP